MKKPFWILPAVLALVLCAGTAYGLDDGFGAAKKSQGQHFTLLFASQVDPEPLAMKVCVRPDSFVSGEGGAQGVAAEVDRLFSRVSDILDMQLYSYSGSIKVCRDSEQLKEIFRHIFGSDLEASSFYVNELNTIYIDQQHFTAWILGHEIGHAIMSHYFVVPPPVKISEVLAGYVEYQLRKCAR